MYRALGRNAHVKACSSSRRLFEKNPICTSYNHTYENPFQAICSASGLQHVREKVGGPCGNPTQKSCEKVRKMQESLKTASITERTKFLACGSDLRTYRSEHHLECSRPYNRCRFTSFCSFLTFKLHFSSAYWLVYVVLALLLPINRLIFRNSYTFFSCLKLIFFSAKIFSIFKKKNVPFYQKK